MMWAAVGFDGSTSPMLFVKDGVKVNSEVYIKVLAENVVLWVTGTYGTHYILTQDGAPAHTANNTAMVQGPFLQFFV